MLAASLHLSTFTFWKMVNKVDKVDYMCLLSDLDQFQNWIISLCSCFMKIMHVVFP